MPVDVAMQLYMHAPIQRVSYRTKRSMYVNKPLRPCIHLHINEDSPETNHRTKEHKRVSFADSKGLPLTSVKLFDLNEFDISFRINELISNLLSLKTVDKDSLLLDFDQPTADYVDFEKRLESDTVCLENCMLEDKLIVGTVKVKNLAFEKSLKVRITFDTWKSFREHDCRYVLDPYGGSDRDTFAFEIHLPEYIAPHERVEFAIRYESEGKTWWDSNLGQNYRIIRSELKCATETTKPTQPLDAILAEAHHLPGYGMEFDQYGGLRCSYGVFPEWPSYTDYENKGPYY
uniref:Protein phosphatase 1 regulatory subunit n=1 Tax=Callorhinchus milii TaxID=7868 RepID=V9KQE7_CALMI|eukprot:gi/632962192/ref/XP_007897173.1/ PREDICTED: protein phosphatase 1 regulatory subunit 3B [Callorhinchus milii]